MTWRMTPVRALSTTSIPSGADVRVSCPEMRELYMGVLPSLLVHRVGQEIPDLGVTPDVKVSSADLEHLAEQAREWADQLEEAARVRRSQEDTAEFRDAG